MCTYVIGVDEMCQKISSETSQRQRMYESWGLSFHRKGQTIRCRGANQGGLQNFSLKFGRGLRNVTLELGDAKKSDTHEMRNYKIKWLKTDI